MAQQLLDFDLEKARLGATLGYKDSDENIHLATYVEFKEFKSDNTLIGYISFDGINNYLFTRDGIVFDKSTEKIYQLYIVSSEITKTTGTKIARVTESDGTSNAKPAPSSSSTSAAKSSSSTTVTATEEIFSIATVQPREEIAMHCLQSMIMKYDYPLNFDNTKIKQLVDKSFLFAQEFINQAVLYREKETTSSTVESTEYTTVDSDSLSSDTDKLLYNISSALSNLIAQRQNQYADQQKNGLKVNTDFPETINAVVNGSIDASVTGEVSAKVSGTVSTVEATL